ncbi:MAG: SOS response-associated peptidase [Proteobacteria bacterium]|nr:MAG: SOS response-associated peptidase [Pseudomonadota bacterium]
MRRRPFLFLPTLALMCGRFTLTDPQHVKERYKALSLFETGPRFNRGPLQTAPVVLQRDDDTVIDGFKWGLLAPWMSPKDGFKTINARVEGLRDTEKPTKTYVPAVKAGRRCIIPADGFYEWKDEKHGPLKKDIVKVPHYYRFKDGRIFSMAGLWQEWEGMIEKKDEDGKKVEEKGKLVTFTIITALPIEIVKEVHDRSPVILTREAEAAWLDPSVGPSEALGLLNPYENHEEMETFRVRQEVGSFRNDFPALIEPVKDEPAEDELAPEQGKLFK